MQISHSKAFEIYIINNVLNFSIAWEIKFMINFVITPMIKLKLPSKLLSLWLLVTILTLAELPSVFAASLDRPSHLRCEYVTDGVDTGHPRLGWQLTSSHRGERQTAYQILVASEESLLASNRADLWDTGKVASPQSALVPYNGKPLTSALHCFWKVRAWNQEGKPSEYSPVSHWTMGLLAPSDWHGKWIGATESTDYEPAPYFRHDFVLPESRRAPALPDTATPPIAPTVATPATKQLKRATAYICGLGYYELHLNGKKVGDHVLDPGYTRYDRRALYVTYDVTQQLQPGSNTVGIVLGTGWENVHSKAVWYFDKAPWRAAPKALLEIRLEFTDGSTDRIVTDETWKTSPGPILYDSIYGGQTYDARRELPGWDSAGYNDRGWQPAHIVSPPGGHLTAQPCPPIRVAARIKPVAIKEPKPGLFVFDMGQNFAGWAELTVAGPVGTRVTLRYGERLASDGTLDQSHIAQHQVKSALPPRFQTDEYILKGATPGSRQSREIWHAQFCYHGFQYVEVTGFPGRPTLDNLTGLFIHSDVGGADRQADFDCSDPALTRLWRNTCISYLSNLQSIPTDCPHREKNGWTGDAHLAAEFGLLNFDSAGVYTKWINDLDDEQRPTGELPGIVPSSGWGYEWGNGPAWDSAFLLIPWYCYRYAGDPHLLTDHYAGIKRYVDYLTTRAKDHIVSIGLGDWVPYETQTPVEVTSTAYYYRDARIVAEVARLLGKTDDAKIYDALADAIKIAFNRAFFHPETAIYANGGQTSLSCALYQDLVPSDQHDAVVQSLVRAVERRNGHIDTGILGAKYILHALTDNGQAAVANTILTQKSAPGWLWWQEQGATTLWESWGGADSRNHIMFGDASAWLIETLAGITPLEPGFAVARIQPHPTGSLTSAHARIHTLYGPLVSDWRIDPHTRAITLHVEIPVNSSAIVYVPTRPGAISMESGKPASRQPGIRPAPPEPGYEIFTVGSGKYTFTSSL